jgi:hypothetical protein
VLPGLLTQGYRHARQSINPDDENMNKKTKQPKKLANELILVSLVMVGLLLVWDATTRISGFNDRQRQLAGQSVKAATSELETYIRGYQRAVDIFAEENRFFLNNVELWPQDKALYAELEEKIVRFFPDSLSFTLADEHGETLLHGMEELVGPTCRKDIKEFAVSDEGHKTYRHQSPSGKYPHFDLMTHWEGSSSSDQIFFIGIKTDRIEEILRNADVLGHRLMLVRREDPASVEVIPPGSRGVLPEDGRLGPNEMRRISATSPVENTRWDVVVLPQNTLYSEAHRNILVRSIIIFMGFIVVSAIMRMILLDDDQ